MHSICTPSRVTMKSNPDDIVTPALPPSVVSQWQTVEKGVCCLSFDSLRITGE